MKQIFLKKYINVKSKTAVNQYDFYELDTFKIDSLQIANPLISYLKLLDKIIKIRLHLNIKNVWKFVLILGELIVMMSFYFTLCVLKENLNE